MYRCVLLFLVVATSFAPAGEVKTWHHESQKDFTAGELSRVTVDSSGKVTLASAIRSKADPKATHIWDAALDASGMLYVATGSPGAVYQLDAQGKLTSLFEEKQSQVFSITVAKDGTVYAGISPGGEIVKLKSGQEMQVVFRTMETYIWDLATDAAGNIYAATGPNGKLFKVDPTGSGSVLYQAKQKHLLSIAVAESGPIYVGTDSDGIVYRISPEGKPYVLLDASQADIHTLLLDRDVLYAGTGTPERPKLTGGSAIRGSGGPPSSTSIGSSPERTDAASDDAVAVATSNGSSSTGSSSTSSSSRASSSSPGQNAVYRIQPDGAYEEIFKEKTLILSLAVQGDRLLIGTGQEGRLYQVDLETQKSAELARLEHGQIDTLLTAPDGTVILATGSPGKIYTLDNKYSDTGSITSDVLDASLQTRWGKTTWRADVPDGTSFELLVRTGNVSEPDSTWTPWTRPEEGLPVGRFFQYRANFRSPQGKQSPALQAVTVFYATVNQAPAIESIEVPDIQASPLKDANSKLKIKWKATDPNSDTLTYKLEGKKEDWPAWIILADNLDKTEYDWDPGTLPGGTYQVRVTVSDRKSNRDVDSRDVSQTSQSFIVDREAPTIDQFDVSITDGKVDVRCQAVDSQTRLVAAEYAINGKTWIPLFPEDSIWDSQRERVAFQTDRLEKGTHILLVRFQDSAGHLGVADKLITID